MSGFNGPTVSQKGFVLSCQDLPVTPPFQDEETKVWKCKVKIGESEEVLEARTVPRLLNKTFLHLLRNAPLVLANIENSQH